MILFIYNFILLVSNSKMAGNGQGICDVAADLFGQPVPQLNNDLQVEVNYKS